MKKTSSLSNTLNLGEKYEKFVTLSGINSGTWEHCEKSQTQRAIASA